MVAEGSMNNREPRSGAGQRNQETFVVDLTTVCLRSGTVRLPLSLIGRFSEGQHKVTAGGEEQMIEFEAPRALQGLAPFFAREGLKANDRVEFCFDGGQLVLTAHKRERPRTTRQAVSPAVIVRNVPAETGSTGSDGRIRARGLFPAPAQLVDSPNGAASEEAAPAAGGSDEPARPAATEQWHSTTVNAVKRVRIEGGLPPRADTVTPRPVDRASAHEVWARRQRPAWRSLDTMIAGPVVPPEEAAEAFSESTVRVVRRSKGTSTPLEVEFPPLAGPKEKNPREAPRTPATTEQALAEQEQAPAAPPSYSMSWPLPEEPRERPIARPADVPLSRGEPKEEAAQEPTTVAPAASAPTATPRPKLDPYLDAPIDADKEASYAPPTILESDLLSLPASGKWRTESEEAFLRYQEAQVASAAERVPVQVERKQGLFGRLGLGRGGRQGGSEAPSRQEPEAPPPAAAQQLFEPEPQPKSPAAPQRSEAPRQPRVIVDESVYDVDFETDVAPHLANQAEPGSLEDDMARLQVYFGQPDVPAIVRCDDLAEKLQMSEERVSTAMFRLAEDRERFTPLRGDAYMVRRLR